MSGFFKKLFNRITGKKEEAPPPAAELEVLPPPAAEPEPAPVAATESAPVPEPVAEVPAAPPVVEEPKPRKAPTKKPAAKKPEPKKPVPKVKAKKAEAKKPEAKETEAKKAEPKAKPEPKAKVKPEPRKVEARKPEPKTPEARKPVPKKTEAKKPEPERLEPPPPPPPPVEIAVEPEAEPTSAPPPPAPPAPAPEPVEEAAARAGWFNRLKAGLSKSSKSITGSITSIFTKRKLDADTLQDLEDVLLQADLGLPMAERIIKAVSTGRYNKEVDPEEVKRILAAEVAKVLKPVEVPFNFGAEKPFIILVVGVNGAGKTTTIGKLGAIATAEGFKVMFAACDTFRAAAIEQLTVWGQRIGAKTMSRPTGADASGLAFDAIKEAKADGTDILFIDTAGRLQNKQYLMDELDKIVRVIKKQDETAPHAVLLVLDATTGQNAMAQADIFTKVAGVTGIIMTKLDGTARGGILVAIAETFKLPVHAIGVGETIDDLQPFDAEGFARAIAGLEAS